MPDVVLPEDFALGLAASVAVHAALWWKLPRYPGYAGGGHSSKQDKPVSLIILPTPNKRDDPQFGEKPGMVKRSMPAPA